MVGCGRSDEFTLDGEATSFHRPTFIYVGNLKPHKNVDVLLHAIRMRPAVDLIIVSNDAIEARSRAASLGLGEQVSVLTGVSDEELASLYRGAVGVLQPSLLEGFGLPALEAMSCGTRVAYWRGCESVAEICAGEGIEVSEANSAQEWASALDSLAVAAFGGPLRMGESWQSRYSWDSVATKVDATIRRQVASE